MRHHTNPYRFPPILKNARRNAIVLSASSMATLSRLDNLGQRRSLQLGPKHSIPESARDPKAILIIRVMVLHMVLLKILVI